MWVETTAWLTWAKAFCFGISSLVRTRNRAAECVEVRYAFAPRPSRQTSNRAAAADALIWIDRLLKIPRTERSRAVACVGLARADGSATCSTPIIACKHRRRRNNYLQAFQRMRICPR